MKSKSLGVSLLLVLSALMVSSLPVVHASSIGLDGSVGVSGQTGAATFPFTGLSTTSTGDFIIVETQIANQGGILWLGNFTVGSLSDSMHLVNWQPSARATLTNLCAGAYGNSTVVEWYGVEKTGDTIPATDSIRINFTSTGLISVGIHTFAVSGTGGFDAHAGLTFAAKSCSTSTSVNPTVSGVSTASGNDFVFAVAQGFQSQVATQGTIGILNAAPIQSTTLIGLSEYTIQSGTLSASSCTATNSASIAFAYWTILCDALKSASVPASTLNFQCPNGEYAYNITSDQGFKCSAVPVGGGPSSCLTELGYVCTSTSSSSSSTQTIPASPTPNPITGLPPNSTLPSYTLPVALFVLAAVIVSAFAYNSLRNKGTRLGRLGKERGLSMTGSRGIISKIKGAFS